MSAATDGMEEIVQEFLVESNECLDLLDRDLVELERDPASRTLLDAAFRALHTLKGNSAALSFPGWSRWHTPARTCCAGCGTASCSCTQRLPARCWR